MNPPKTPAFHYDREKTAEPIRPREFSRTTPELPAGEPARWSFFFTETLIESKDLHTLQKLSSLTS